MITNHKIIIGDSRRMEEVSDQSVHLVVTSPPYWQLKDYGPEDQIGFNDTYEEYVNNLNLVWNECYRVLHDGCRMAINIGDQFARAVYYGRYKVVPIRTEVIKFCETIGFDYMGAVIWQKVTTCNTTGGATIMGSFPYPRNGILKLDYEFILLFKKPGRGPKPTKQIKEQSKLTTEEWNRYFTGHWNFPGVRQNKHLAQFPEELPKRLIKMFTFVGETVLDPFLGSGTTSLAAQKLYRDSIGYEVNRDFLPIIKESLGVDQKNLVQAMKFELCEQNTDPSKIKGKLASLPYLFRDTVAFNKQTDLKKMKFGSKIDKHDFPRAEYYTVKKIISPNLLVLNSGLQIKLIGIRERKATRFQAMDFLRKKTRGQKVFMKFDSLKYDEDGNLLCYLYLQNKTFINAHLIKEDIVDVDVSFGYKFKSKFLNKRSAYIET